MKQIFYASFTMVHCNDFLISKDIFSDFRIIVDLLRMNVAPSAIERMLKSMLSSAPKSKAQSTGDAHPPTHSGREMPNPPNAPASSKRRFPPSGKSHDRRTQEKPKS